MKMKSTDEMFVHWKTIERPSVEKKKGIGDFA